MASSEDQYIQGWAQVWIDAKEATDPVAVCAAYLTRNPDTSSNDARWRSKGKRDAAREYLELRQLSATP